jgi:hypothetical protein
MSHGLIVDATLLRFLRATILGASNASTVKYGKASGRYTHSTCGTWHTYVNPGQGYNSGQLHVVQLTGLKPGWPWSALVTIVQQLSTTISAEIQLLAGAENTPSKRPLHPALTKYMLASFFIGHYIGENHGLGRHKFKWCSWWKLLHLANIWGGSSTNSTRRIRISFERWWHNLLCRLGPMLGTKLQLTELTLLGLLFFHCRDSHG